MIIKTAEYSTSSGSIALCPPPSTPEFAFIGRSNVGKSSLINMLTNNKKLAHVSKNPGKTQCINHFAINKSWFLVDLPGYGFAKVSKEKRNVFSKMILDFLSKRETLHNTFILIDSRIEPQQIDIEFIKIMHKREVPFSIIFTKADKIGKNVMEKNIAVFRKAMLEIMEELPYMIISSANDKKGKDEILTFIENIISSIPTK